MTKKVAVCAAAAVGVAVAVVAARRRARRAEGMVRELRKKCEISEGRLRLLADAMLAEMRVGLASEGGSKLKMLLSHVDNLPTRNEEGLFYALDLGGTNFRVLHIQLGGKEGRVVRQEVEEVSIPPHLMVGSSNNLQNLSSVKV